jgi:hypothetical protein
VNTAPSVHIAPRRSNRGPAIALCLCLAAIVPVLGILAGLAAVWLSIYSLAQRGFGTWQRVALSAALALAVALTVLQGYLATHLI